jgi:hypothetical protein
MSRERLRARGGVDVLLEELVRSGSVRPAHGLGRAGAEAIAGQQMRSGSPSRKLRLGGESTLRMLKADSFGSMKCVPTAAEQVLMVQT